MVIIFDQIAGKRNNAESDHLTNNAIKKEAAIAGNAINRKQAKGIRGKRIHQIENNYCTMFGMRT